MNKPVYLGPSVAADIRIITIYNFKHDYTKPKYEEKNTIMLYEYI